MHFKKLRNVLSSKFTEIEFLFLLCCVKQIGFFGSFDKFKMYQLCLHFSIRIPNHMLSKNPKSAPKVAPKIRLEKIIVAV